jgi:hypothetical protein
MATHQCPRCELQFMSTSELEWHLLDDHGSRIFGPGSSVAAAEPIPSPATDGAR